MIRPRQIRLKLNKSTFQHCQQLSQETAHVWNTVKNFFWRTYRKKGIWLSESSMKRYLNGRFALHSQSVQAIIEKFYDNLKAACSLRKENPSIRYPYKNKNWFCVHWKKGAIKVDVGISASPMEKVVKVSYSNYWLILPNVNQTVLS